MSKFYITTAIPYVNAKPHIGFALELVQADAAARYRRLRGDDVFFLTGTDDNALKNVQAAEDAGVSVEKFVRDNASLFKNLANNLNLSNDYFIETSADPRHKKGAQKLWKAAEKDIYKKKYSGLYCVGCEEFKTEKELVNGRCHEHPDKDLIEVSEENYFFKLSAYEDKLKELIESDTLCIVPESRKNEMLAFIDSGLQDFSISRSVERARGWGISVPGDGSQIQYVWFDALSNYINALDYPGGGEKYKKYWENGDDIIHVIGKGITRFHAIYWPAMLLSAGLRLPKTVFVHGYITIDKQKISKSLGNVIDPNDIIDKYGADALRWYLLAEIPPTKDGDFSYDKFEGRYNGDLALGLGNLLARITSLGEKYLNGSLESKLSAASKKELRLRWKNYEKAMEEFEFSDAIKEAHTLISYADKQINDTKLWQLAKESEDKFKEVISDVATVLANVAFMLSPVIPETSDKIFEQLGVKPNAKSTWKFKMRKGEALFPRLE